MVYTVAIATNPLPGAPGNRLVPYQTHDLQDLGSYPHALEWKD
jgi:hypothetical protein